MVLSVHFFFLILERMLVPRGPLRSIVIKLAVLDIVLHLPLMTQAVRLLVPELRAACWEKRVCLSPNPAEAVSGLQVTNYHVSRLSLHFSCG